jgi:hypothetical protein
LLKNTRIFAVLAEMVVHFRRRKTGLASTYQKKFWFAQKGRSYAKPIY